MCNGPCEGVCSSIEVAQRCPKVSSMLAGLEIPVGRQVETVQNSLPDILQGTNPSQTFTQGFFAGGWTQNKR